MSADIQTDAKPDLYDRLKTVTLVATDIDGTLTENEMFSSLLLDALHDLADLQITVVAITGRSAGWVNGLNYYLPVAGAIAENGGVFFPSDYNQAEVLVSIGDRQHYRQQLAEMFNIIQAQFPNLKESLDNAFRWTDWTFNIEDIDRDILPTITDLCAENDWMFTYSSVQGHIMPKGQNKAQGLIKVCDRYFPDHPRDQILTIGDSLNDDSLFNPDLFPVSFGVANIHSYLPCMTHRPTYITQASEVQGFCEMVAWLKTAKTSS